jgi:MFS family permease
LSDAHRTPDWVYRAVLAVAAALGLASFALSFFVRDAQSVDNEIGPTDEESIKPTIRTALFGMPRSYWYVLGMLGLFSLANSSDTFLLLRASDLGFSPWAVVLVYALFNLTYAGLSYPIGVLSDRLGRWRMIALGWTIYAVVYAVIAWLPQSQSWGLWPLMGMYGVYMALTDGVGKALIADHAPKDARGAAMGLFYALTGLATLIASLLAGYAWDRVGPQAALMLGAGFALVALLALALAPKPDPTTQLHP